MTRAELIEQLSDAEHASWAHWMHYLFSVCATNPTGSMTIPAELVQRWQTQAATPYANLTEREQASDRAEVRKILPTIDAYVTELTQARALLEKE